MPFRTMMLAVFCLLVAPDWARADDRPLNDDERVKLDAAMQAAGCSGGSAEADDDSYDVDDARCADGRKYDLTFDKSFNLIGKDADD